MKKVVILGGAGFIGSIITGLFLKKGYEITVIDGFLKQTGASINHLSEYGDRILVINKRVEEIPDLTKILDSTDLIIDCMGFSAHHLAIADPIYDQSLNVNSHLTVILALKEKAPKKIIYLGSRGQYGNPLTDEIPEFTSQVPEDVQGINKVAAESYYRVYSKYFGLDVISLRTPNCFGENQPVFEGDIGLIGGFIFDALQDKSIKVFGSERRRSILYVQDLAQIVYKLASADYTGFLPLNINGISLKISDLALKIKKLSHKGKVVFEDMPENIKRMDVGSAVLDEKKIMKLIGSFKYTDINLSLKKTIDYVKQAR